MLNYTRYTGDSLAEGCRLILEHGCHGVPSFAKGIDIPKKLFLEVCANGSLMTAYSLLFLKEITPEDTNMIVWYDENYENELQEIIIVTTDANTYVAAGMLSRVTDKNSNTPSYLQVFTKPNYRNQGIATQVISVFAQYNDISNHHFKGEKICPKSELVSH
jgi:GNAT superfamily N-acetyltransferase